MKHETATSHVTPQVVASLLKSEWVSWSTNLFSWGFLLPTSPKILCGSGSEFIEMINILSKMFLLLLIRCLSLIVLSPSRLLEKQAPCDSAQTGKRRKEGPAALEN